MQLQLKVILGFSTGRSWFAINPVTRTRLHYFIIGKRHTAKPDYRLRPDRQLASTAVSGQHEHQQSSSSS